MSTLVLSKNTVFWATSPCQRRCRPLASVSASRWRCHVQVKEVNGSRASMLQSVALIGYACAMVMMGGQPCLALSQESPEDVYQDVYSLEMMRGEDTSDVIPENNDRDPSAAGQQQEEHSPRTESSHQDGTVMKQQQQPTTTRRRGRIRELEEIKSQLAEKELELLGKETALLEQQQDIQVLKQELEIERKLRALITKEKEEAEEEAALAMGLCTGSTMLP